ncbi:murein L,D-transpeptidase catalytic domain family protein [Erythrobacter mangrovi]|uniref:Murein L,D-transpeptidase catalytic domain family protein n=1 Tax=Erythrobacter mangrovi TaxID=2739433 RepID=A0A7D3XBP6_9SPHN|nr:murein L,D-transpeptidase catalytic domain family protein [Erythrobacter mangrovi]QKG71340.1 murein L,D-transpeptidase catalytic domain family protein [Erythrobacter mangrovi]
MTITRRLFIGGGICIGAGFAAPSAAITNPPVIPPIPQPPVAATKLPLPVSQALEALSKHNARIIHRDRIAVADYALHSAEARFYLVNVEAGQIEADYLVSHGRGSDPANTGYVERFSNRPGSYASSSGSFLTADTYYGKHGRSRRLHGLDPENNRAWDRAIVIHGADYVDRSMAELQGRVGRSLGCFAFEQDKISEILERLGPGRLLFSTK